MSTAGSSLLVAVIAGTVALLGYLVNSRIGRLRERERYFIDALLAVERYKQLPYWRHRLQDSTEFRKKIGEVHENLAYHRRLLQFDSPEVYKAYAALVNTIRSRYREVSTSLAFEAVEVDGASIELAKLYRSLSKPDRDECLRLMRGRLRLFPLTRRRYRRPDRSVTPTDESELRELSE